MDWSDTGFVVAKGLFREADVWLRILFRGHGMQTVFAFGGAHSRRRFVGCLDVMNILTCRVSPSRRGTYLDLEEAVLEKGPERLRHSPALLGIAANCLKFTRAVGVPEQSGEEGFRLLSEMLARLESGDAPSVLSPFFPPASGRHSGIRPRLRHLRLVWQACRRRGAFLCRGSPCAL